MEWSVLDRACVAKDLDMQNKLKPNNSEILAENKPSRWKMVFVIFMNAHRCYNKQCTTWNIIWGGINTKCDTVINPAKQTLYVHKVSQTLVDRPTKLFYILMFICVNIQI